MTSARGMSTTTITPRPSSSPAVDTNNNSGTKIQAKDLLKLPSMDKKMVEIILDEIVDKKNVKFNDIGKTISLF